MNFAKSRFKKGEHFGKWELSEFIGGGGNGDVWKATLSKDVSQVVAIKLLKRINVEGYKRFKDEVKIICENNDINGILPIIDKYLPENLEGQTPWYVMPLSVPLMKKVDTKTPEQVIDIIISVSNILIDLHRRGISHRDIKPGNILVKDDQIFLSDFGLVDYPTKEHITLGSKDLGPRWTIAPEMKRNPRTSDGKLADVYSLAKTLWILLTREEKGFEGQYIAGTSIDIKHFVPSIYQGTIDGLMHQCTDNNPKNRPSIEEFRDKLLKWKELNSDFEKRTKSEWVDIQKRLFPSAMPKRVIWEDIADIITVLTVVSDYKLASHTLFPNGGGLDLKSVKLSFEAGCLELNFGHGMYIVKPRLLILESFKEHTDWSYLRLETEGLKLIGKYEQSRDDEGLTELEPCVYTNYECYEFDDFNGEHLPRSARQVVRLAKGSFMICLRTGIYNSISSTYDGRHNKMNADDFRSYIERLIKSSDASSSKGVSVNFAARERAQFKSPIFKESTKVRQGSRILDPSEITIIKKVITLFKEAQKEHDKLNEDFGINDTFVRFDIKTVKAMIKVERAPRPKNDEFRKYLNSLSDAQLLLIEAVMYGGRDALSTLGRSYPLEDMLVKFKNDTKKSRLASITEKSSLDLYLAAGIKAYKESRQKLRTVTKN